MITSNTQPQSLFKSLRRPLGYTALILIGAMLLGSIVFSITGDDDLASLVCLCSIFIGVLAVLTAELRKRDVLLERLRQQEASAPPYASYSPLPAWQEQPVSSAGNHYTVLEFECALFSLRASRCSSQNGTAL